VVGWSNERLIDGIFNLVTRKFVGGDDGLVETMVVETMVVETMVVETMV
jgi:hypothetical protein